MSPLLIGGAIIAGLALLKKKEGEKKTGGGGATKPPPQSSGTTPKTDGEYLVGDTVGLIGGAAGAIGGGLAALGGGSVGGGLKIIGAGAAAAGAALGLAVIPLAIGAILIAAGIIGARTAEAKSMARMWINYLPSARIMVGYEAARIEQFAVKNNTVVERRRTVLDPRLAANFTADGQKYSYIGERVEFVKTDSAPNAVSYVQIQKAVRAAAIVYALECGKHANALLRNWGPLIGNGGHTQLEPPEFWLKRLYNDLPGYEGKNLGGLNDVPLPDGITEQTRTEPNGSTPPAAQLRALDATPLDRDLIDALVPEAKFIAFKNVLQTIHFDNAVYLPFTPSRYAMDVFNRMELDKQWFVLQGSVIVLPFGAWQFRNESGQPINLNVDVVGVKDNGPMANWYQTLA